MGELVVIVRPSILPALSTFYVSKACVRDIWSTARLTAMNHADFSACVFRVVP